MFMNVQFSQYAAIVSLRSTKRQVFAILFSLYVL